ncbi:MAG: EAL domain-containing protein [Lachnospiraceae bacterium]|nr:EAL domain-containing protein [Lachnospiraceae bacterium]
MISYIYFDYCALVVEALLLISLFVRKMTRGRVNRWALALLIDIIISTSGDAAGLILEGMGSGNIIWKYIANTVCLLGTTMTSVIFCGYLFAMIGILHKIGERRSLQLLYNIPAGLILVLFIIVNPFTKIVFFIDAAGKYQRGPVFYFLYALAYMYTVVGYYELIKYRRLFGFVKLFSVFLVFVMMIGASIYQAFWPLHNVQLFITSASFLVIIFGVLSPEERMHGSTGLYSMNAYVQDINKYWTLKEPITVTLSVMTNYNALTEMLGYFTVQNIIIDTAKRLEKWAVSGHFDVDIYYLGGGRYAVIADERYKDDAITISQEINALLAREVEVGEMLVKVMSNVCFIGMPKDIDNPDFLLAFDNRLAVETYTGELRYAEKLFDKKRFELRRDISKVIDRAFTDRLFSLHFQPVYSVKDKRFVRAEAFLRLNDPEFGEITPDLLIGEAEKTNSIHAITTFVIEEVCRFISMSEFLLLGFDFVEINLSPAQCMWPDLLPVLLSTIRNYNVQAKNICFNITDVASEELFVRMKDNIDALSQVGFIIYMDDFGAGIFEVERIAKMPLSGIKLDRHFVREGLRSENTAIFEGSLTMISDLQIDSVAVGVENEEMEERLMGLNCNYMQGYYFCRPLEKKELIRFILMG